MSEDTEFQNHKNHINKKKTSLGFLHNVQGVIGWIYDPRVYHTQPKLSWSGTQDTSHCPFWFYSFSIDGRLKNETEYLQTIFFAFPLNGQ